MPGIGIGISPHFQNKKFSFAQYWATRTPSGLTVEAITATSVKVDWTANGVEDYDGYSIERSLDGVNYSEVDTVTVGTETLTDTVTADTYYYYRVRAYKGTNYSNYTDVAELQYGPEMVKDVGFDDGSKWTYSAGVAISGSKATITVTSGGVQYCVSSGASDIALSSGATYLIRLTTTLLSGTGELAFCSGQGNNIPGITNHWSTNFNGEVTPTANATAFGLKRYTSSGNYVFEIDNFSVKKKI